MQGLSVESSFRPKREKGTRCKRRGGQVEEGEEERRRGGEEVGGGGCGNYSVVWGWRLSNGNLVCTVVTVVSLPPSLSLFSFLWGRNALSRPVVRFRRLFVFSWRCSFRGWKVRKRFKAVRRITTAKTLFAKTLDTNLDKISELPLAPLASAVLATKPR